MLVLSRKTTEEIMIGDDVVITIVEIRGNRVRLGVKAPHNVNIRRSELPDERTLSDAGLAVANDVPPVRS